MRNKLIISLVLAVFLAVLTPFNAAASDDINAYTPYNLSAALMPVDEMHPSGSVDLTFKINDLPDGTDDAPWGVEIQKKIGDGDWVGVSFVRSTTYKSDNSLGGNSYHFEQIWNESTEWNTDIMVYFRVRVAQCDSTFSAVDTTAWSNVASIGIKSSAWASSLIDKASQYGLLPDSLAGIDYTKPITREQFAELAVKLYEISANSSADPISPNPFRDTSNMEILKAFKLGIVKGIAADRFEPNAYTNREQIAAMLYRAVKDIKPDGDFSTDGAPIFADASLVSGWALENVKFMTKSGYIAGVGGNRFDPKGTATCEQAIAIAVRVYEKAEGIN